MPFQQDPYLPYPGLYKGQGHVPSMFNRRKKQQANVQGIQRFLADMDQRIALGLPLSPHDLQVIERIRMAEYPTGAGPGVQNTGRGIPIYQAWREGLQHSAANPQQTPTPRPDGGVSLMSPSGLETELPWAPAPATVADERPPREGDIRRVQGGAIDLTGEGGADLYQAETMRDGRWVPTFHNFESELFEHPSVVAAEAARGRELRQQEETEHEFWNRRDIITQRNWEKQLDAESRKRIADFEAESKITQQRGQEDEMWAREGEIAAREGQREEEFKALLPIAAAIERNPAAWDGDPIKAWFNKYLRFDLRGLQLDDEGIRRMREALDQWESKPTDFDARTILGIMVNFKDPVERTRAFIRAYLAAAARDLALVKTLDHPFRGPNAEQLTPAEADERYGKYYRSAYQTPEKIATDTRTLELADYAWQTLGQVEVTEDGKPVSLFFADYDEEVQAELAKLFDAGVPPEAIVELLRSNPDADTDILLERAAAGAYR